jgi:hypothetical protein
MGISELITKHCTQTCVYWGSPQNDGEGGFTFADPVELYCRWEGKVQVIKDDDAKGGEIECVAIVYLLQDVVQEGFLFLGTLDDLEALEDSDGNSSGGWYNPLAVDGAYKIKQFEKLPALGSTTVFVRRAYLTEWSYR